MKVEITWEERGYLATFNGSFSMAEVLHNHQRLFQNPKWDEISYGILDFSKADLSEMDERDSIFVVSAIYEKAQNTSGHRDYAFVAGDPHIRELIEEYREKLLSFGISWRLEIFSNMDEARNWINTQLAAGDDRSS